MSKTSFHCAAEMSANVSIQTSCPHLILSCSITLYHRRQKSDSDTSLVFSKEIYANGNFATFYSLLHCSRHKKKLNENLQNVKKLIFLYRLVRFKTSAHLLNSCLPLLLNSDEIHCVITKHTSFKLNKNKIKLTSTVLVCLSTPDFVKINPQSTE